MYELKIKICRAGNGQQIWQMNNCNPKAKLLSLKYIKRQNRNKTEMRVLAIDGI